MVTISVEAHKNRQDLRRYIERGVARLQLAGASASLEKVIRDTLEAKAEGMFLWVRLMLNVLEVQSTEQEILHVLNTAPTDIEGMVREVLKVYSSTLKGREAEEFNTILAWISFAARPLTLAELDAALRRAAPSGGPVLSLEAKLREKFGSVITLVRDDGLSTGMLQSRIQSPGDSVAFDSKYETTSIGFAHASIAEYFRKGEGKFAARKTYPKIGVVYAEAHACLLKSCLEVFVAPGEGESKKAAATLKTYARDHWYNHLQCSISQPFDTIDQMELLKTLFSFLNEPDVLRGWCEGTPWTFYNEEAATVLCSCIESWYQYESTEIDAGIRSWIKTSSRQKAEFIFLPAAKINGEQGLHRDGFGDDWPPLPAITSVVQIRALIEDDDTLDTLPYPPPLETLLKAVRWLRLEENAVYNRKLAVCLRNLEYVAESIPYFEKALQLDESYVPARSGLAIIYRKQGYFTKALELELTNATYLTQQLKSRGNNEGITKELGRSYGLIAYCYGKIDNKAAAMRYWRLAAKTTYIVKWGIYAYLRFLWTSPKDNRWSEIIWLLKSMEQAQDDKENYSRLTACILENAYPKETPDAFFRMLGRAAMEENCFSWLESVYHTAITQSKDHVTTIDLKMSLVELHRIFTEDMPGAERLIEELLEIACLDEESSIQQLERCKEKLGQDYCRICVRKSIHAAQDRVECDKYIARLTRLCRSGLEPRALRNKCTYNERSSLYLASLQRRYGDVTDAGLSLGPYLIESCHMALSPNPRTMRNGLQGLGDALIAMGMYNEAVSFLSVTHSQVMWVCDSCRRSHSTDQGKAASICDVCLAAFCSNCGSELESGSFCVPGHSMVKVPASATLRGPSCDIRFRGNVVPLKEAVKFILQEWQELFM
jgi:tetratricopeptide (TPR) repeat protein